MLGGGSATPPLGTRPLGSKCTGPGRGSTCSSQSIVDRYLARTRVTELRLRCPLARLTWLTFTFDITENLGGDGKKSDESNN